MDCSLGEAESQTIHPVRTNIPVCEMETKSDSWWLWSLESGRAGEKEWSLWGRLTCEVSDPPRTCGESSVTLCFAKSRKSSSLVQSRPGSIISGSATVGLQAQTPEF